MKRGNDMPISEMKNNLIADINKRKEEKIIETTNAELLIKLITNADTDNEAMMIAELGTMYKRTGFHFDARLERIGTDINYLKKNNDLSFDQQGIYHKLIIGDNYNALQNLLISYKGKVDIIYIDPPYAKDTMGVFAQTNYDNNLTRDNLISMLQPRLLLAKQLLSDDGVIFISIDDRNQSYIKCLMDEIFTEKAFLFCLPRITKKGGKTSNTIQKNHDYVIAYTKSDDIIFSQLDRDNSSFTLEDEYVAERGKYKVTQTLDYSSLSYGESMDYPLEFNGQTYYPGGSKDDWERRQRGEHRNSDWTWRWSKSAVEWGIENGFIVLNENTNRIYTKTYEKCRKVNGKNEIEYFEPGKPYTTLSYIDNECSNDTGKKELDLVFNNGEKLFKNPKPVELIYQLIKMACLKKDAVVLDFFAGSGTTGQAVLDLNKNDNGSRQFILCTNNEITSDNPHGIAYDVTSRRLKRVMTGSEYDLEDIGEDDYHNGTSDFDWLTDHEPYGDSLNVYEINRINSADDTHDNNPITLIDEKDYDLDVFTNIQDKIEWICKNFENTQRIIESNEDYLERILEEDI